MRLDKFLLIGGLALGLVGCGGGPQMPTTPQEMVQVLASESLPFYTTTTFQTASGRLDMNCMPTPTGVECSGVDQPAQQATMAWRHVYNYVLLQAAGRRLVVECSANVRWSHCVRPEPGSYIFTQAGDKVQLEVLVGGNTRWVEYSILAEGR